MGFLVRRILFLMGVGLVLMILALNASPRHREMSYSLIVVGSNPRTNSYALYEIDFQTLEIDMRLSGMSSPFVYYHPEYPSPYPHAMPFTIKKPDSEEVYLGQRYQPTKRLSNGEFTGWSQNGKIVFNDNGRLKEMHLDGTGQQEIIGNHVTWAGLSPSKNHLVFWESTANTLAESDGIWVIQFPTKNPQRLTNRLVKYAHKITNDWFYYYDRLGGIYRVSLDGAFRQELISSSDYNSPKFILSNNDKFAVLQLGSNWYISGTDASILFNLTEKYGAIEFVDFSPDDEWVIFVSPSGTYRCKLDGTQLQQLSSEQISTIIWSSDREWAYFSTPNGLMRLNWETLALKQLSPVWASLNFPLSPDDEWLVLSLVNHERLMLYRIQTNGGNLEPLSSEEIYQKIGWLITPEYPYHSLRWLTLGVLLMGGVPLLTGVVKGRKWLRRVIG